eukprot:3898263-Rhodomonas_salina.1
MAEVSALKEELAVGKKLWQVCIHSDQQEVETWIASFRSGRRAQRRLKLSVCTLNYSEQSVEPALSFAAIKSLNARAQLTFRFVAKPHSDIPIPLSNIDAPEH